MAPGPFGDGSEQVLVDGFQAVVGQFRQSAPGQFQSAGGPAVQRQSQPAEFVPQECQIEPGVVGHEQGRADEISESRVDLFRQRLVGEHVVGDAVNHGYVTGDRLCYPDQAAELRDDLPLLHKDGSHFDDPVAISREKAGGFHIDRRLEMMIFHDISPTVCMRASRKMHLCASFTMNYPSYRYFPIPSIQEIP